MSERDGYAKRISEDEFVDEIRMVQVERWKDSELSGNEWRFAVRVQFFRKGIMVHEKSYRDFATALAAAPWEFIIWREENMDNVLATHRQTDHLCFQPGCKQAAGPKMFLLQEWSDRGEGPLPPSSFPSFRRFCDKHGHRGDGSFEDADVNYSPMPPVKPS